MGIFSDTAPAYWAAGLPAIPLLPKLKRPAVNGWQLFADQQPSEEEKAAWMRVYADGNIGLPMGSASGLVAIDIDTDEPKVIALLDRLLPPTPWHRVGKKGEVRIYRYTGEKTTRFQTKEQMICEVLSKGTQIVLPPSIHPETLKPYTANAPLHEVLMAVPGLPGGIEDLIRDSLRDIGIDVGSANSNKTVNYVPAGQRDNTVTWHAGLLARAVTRGERTLLEALGEMEHWVDSYVEQVEGDAINADKAKKKVIYFILRDVNGPRNVALPIGWDDGLSDEDKVQLGMNVSDEDEKWTSNQIIERMAADVLHSDDPASEYFQKSVHECMLRIARAGDTLSILDVDRIFKFIASQSRGTIGITSLRKQLKVLQAGDIEGTNHDEIAKEVMIHMNEFGEVRFHVGKFWRWRGSHWEELDEAEIMKVISSEFGNLPACKKTSDYHGILKLLRSTASKPLQQVRVKGVNFANGFLDQDMNMNFHHPDYGMTYVLPYRYMPDEAGRMPMFGKFLLDSWGLDADYNDKVSLVQEMMGATLFSVATHYQKAFCLFGQAGSGKSVMSQIMRALLPEGSVSAIPPEDWNDTFLPAEMFGKVMNFAGELSETRFIPGEHFKSVVEGEIRSAQKKNGQPFDFRPLCSQWFNSNHLPRTRDTSGGFNRRWLFLEWMRVVPKDKVVVDLASKVVNEEREAIAAWAVLGYLRLVKNNGYTEPSSHLALVDQMSVENNSVRYFLKTCPLVIVGKGNLVDRKVQSISTHDLYSEYWAFCLATGIAKRVASNSFVRMMHELQSQFDFRILNENNVLGSQEVIFDGISLISAN